jgi:methionyl-tRNA synthetase
MAHSGEHGNHDSLLVEDGDITLESFKDAYNAHLANGLGNLVSRIMKMASDNLTEPVDLNEENYPKIDYKEQMEKFEINNALDLIWSQISWLDEQIQIHQPFKVVKTDKEKGVNKIKELVKDLFVIAHKLEPFLPETSQKIKSLIKENKTPDKPLFARKD